MKMAILFMQTKQNISLHINNCFKEKELVRDSVVKEYLTTRNFKKIINEDIVEISVVAKNALTDFCLVLKVRPNGKPNRNIQNA
jgi:hypothetical protein